MARDDAFFTPRWIAYYSREFGAENLFLVLDGHDQALPEGHEMINVLRLPHRAMKRAAGDRNRARLVSLLARSLFQRYDLVIAHDIDECLVVDPDEELTLRDYLLKNRRSSSLSGLGLDVGQHPETEGPIDPSGALLAQRSFAHLSSRYTKAIVARRPLTWGSGYHRVKGRNFHIDPKLYLIHFGMVDIKRLEEKHADKGLAKAGWKGHLERRQGLFELIRTASPKDGDLLFDRARRRQQRRRPLYALNKPGTLKDRPVIRIPERFKKITY